MKTTTTPQKTNKYSTFYGIKSTLQLILGIFLFLVLLLQPAHSSEPPVGLTLIRKSAFQAELTWLPVTGAYCYQLELENIHETNVMIVTETSTKLTGLKYASPYKIRLAAITSAGMTDYTEPMHFITDSFDVVTDTLLKNQWVYMPGIYTTVEINDMIKMNGRNWLLRNTLGQRSENVNWDLGVFSNDNFVEYYKGTAFGDYKMLQDNENIVLYSDSPLDTFYTFNNQGTIITKFTYPALYNFEQRLMTIASNMPYLLLYSFNGDKFSLHNLTQGGSKLSDINGTPYQFFGTNKGVVVLTGDGNLLGYDFQLQNMKKLSLNLRKVKPLNDSLFAGISKNGSFIYLLNSSFKIVWTIQAPIPVKETYYIDYLLNPDLSLTLSLDGHYIFRVSLKGEVISQKELNANAYPSRSLMRSIRLDDEDLLVLFTWEINENTWDYELVLWLLSTEHQIYTKHRHTLIYAPCFWYYFTLDNALYVQEDNYVLKFLFFNKSNKADESGLSITEYSLTEGELYPNPVKSHLYWSGKMPAEAIVFDNQGRKVLASPFPIDMSQLSPGIYLVKTPGGLVNRIVKY